MLADCSSNFIDALCIILKETALTRESYVFHHNEIIDKLFLVSQGEIEFLAGDISNVQVVHTAGRGEFIGELSFFFGMPQTNSARSKLNSQGAVLYYLTKETFTELAKLYPEEEERIVKRVLSTHKPELEDQQMELQDEAGENENEGGSNTAEHLVQVQRNMENEERRKRQQRVMEMISLTAAGDLVELKDFVKLHMLDVNEADLFKRTALHIAAARGHTQIMTWLVSKMQADVTITDMHGMTPLAEAVENQHHSLAKLLHAQGATLSQDEKAGAQLCEFAYHGELERVQLLVENGVSPDIRDYDLRSPLHLAAGQGRVHVVRYLLEKGAPVFVTDRDSKTPYQDAMVAGNREILQLLASRSGDILNPQMAYRLCSLAARDSYEEVKELIDNGLSPTIHDGDRRTALHLAACEEGILVATHLLRTINIGSSINDVDRFGHTPLDDAIRHNSTIMASMLRDMNAKRGSDPGMEQMHAAARQKFLEEEDRKEQAQAAEKKGQTLEMRMLRRLESMVQVCELIIDRASKSCQIFHRSLLELYQSGRSRKPWGRLQAKRYQTLSDTARAMETMSKQFSAELERLMLETEEMNSTLVQMTEVDPVAEMGVVQLMLKKLSQQAVDICLVGRRYEFNLPALRRRGNRKLLKLSNARKMFVAAGSVFVEGRFKQQRQRRRLQRGLSQAAAVIARRWRARVFLRRHMQEGTAAGTAPGGADPAAAVGAGGDNRDSGANQRLHSDRAAAGSDTAVGTARGGADPAAAANAGGDDRDGRVNRQPLSGGDAEADTGDVAKNAPGGTDPAAEADADGNNRDSGADRQPPSDRGAAGSGSPAGTAPGGVDPAAAAANICGDGRDGEVKRQRPTDRGAAGSGSPAGTAPGSADPAAVANAGSDGRDGGAKRQPPSAGGADADTVDGAEGPSSSGGSRGGSRSPAEAGAEGGRRLWQRRRGCRRRVAPRARKPRWRLCLGGRRTRCTSGAGCCQQAIHGARVHPPRRLRAGLECHSRCLVLGSGGGEQEAGDVVLLWARQQVGSAHVDTHGRSSGMRTGGVCQRI
uniref:Potassium channel skor-like n=1 Tax=Tetraselmis sp. GSL018 TaxID=582737 RepID=A0A061S8T2_9CHLO